MFFDNLFDDFNPFGSYSYRQPRPQTASMFRNDNRSIMLRKILNDDYNYLCFDCHTELNELEYFDIKNGIFLCYDCAKEHNKLSKEISQPMTGNLRNMEEKDLMLLYYGGNKNLIDFIRGNFPLLENMNMKDMYSTKAMEYYRALLRAKSYDEPEPTKPGKKKGYNSIFTKKENPVKENHQKHERGKRIIDNNDESMNNLFNSTFFGDDLFGRRKQNNRKNNERNKENLRTEPAVVSRDDNDNTKNKVENNENNTKRDSQSQKKEKEEKKLKHKKINVNKCKEGKIEEKKNIITINQLGELSYYPAAMEIDGMDCE
jgi:hypothetical protein